MSESPVDPTDEQEELVWAEPEPQPEPEPVAVAATRPARRRGLPALTGAVARHVWERRGSSGFRMASGGVAALVIAGVVAGTGLVGGTPEPGPEPNQALVPPAGGGAAGDPVNAPLTGHAGGAVPAAVMDSTSASPSPAASATTTPATAGTPAPVAATTTAARPAVDGTATAVARRVTYRAIAGLGCDAAGTSYARHGWFKDGNGGWWTLASGSTTEGGCNGQFDDMPTSADANAATPGRAMVFGFKPGGGTQSCALELYIPSSPTQPTSADPGRGRRDVIINPVHVLVMTGTGLNSATYGSPSGSRTVSQASNHNSWVSLGSYPVTNGAIGVKITDRGIPWGYPVTDPHIAGGAVRATCTAA